MCKYLKIIHRVLSFLCTYKYKVIIKCKSSQNIKVKHTTTAVLFWICSQSDCPMWHHKNCRRNWSMKDIVFCTQYSLIQKECYKCLAGSRITRNRTRWTWDSWHIDRVHYVLCCRGWTHPVLQFKMVFSHSSQNSKELP